MAERIIFEWDNDAASDEYQIFENGTMIATVQTNSFAIMLGELTQGLHKFTVRGVNSFGEGVFSDELEVNFILPGMIQNFRYTVV